MTFLQSIDPFLIYAYRIPADSLLGYWLGTLALAFGALALGMTTMALSGLLNRNLHRRQSAKMIKMHNLSIRAIQEQNKEGYLATNKLANEMYGRVFFNRAALFTASVWPVPFALAWMNERFADVSLNIPLIDFPFGYVGVFLSCYILLRVAVSFLRIPVYTKLMESLDKTEETPRSWAELGMPGKESPVESHPAA